MRKPARRRSGRARAAAFNRRTSETQIHGRLVLDGEGRYDVSTGIRFLDHMLELFARHGGFDLTLHATGDLDIDQHHTVEDVGITLGEAVLKALGIHTVVLRHLVDTELYIAESQRTARVLKQPVAVVIPPHVMAEAS